MIPKRHVVYVILTGIALSSIYLALLYRPSSSLAEDSFSSKAQTTDTQYSNKSVVHLYFSDKNNWFLTSEQRALLYSDNPVEFGKSIINALIEGPQKGLMRTIPEDTTLRAIYIGPDGTAYVDMSNNQLAYNMLYCQYF